MTNGTCNCEAPSPAALACAQSPCRHAALREEGDRERTVELDAPAFDQVERPIHYADGEIECIDAIECAVNGLNGMEAVLTAQCLKYLWRWRVKHPNNPAEDLKKCRWYLNRLIEQVEAVA